MIRHYMFDSFNVNYSMSEAIELSNIISQAITDGYPVKWNDHQNYSWASIDFETNEELIEFKLRYV